MNLPYFRNLASDPVVRRRAGLGALRFVLHGAGALLRASAPLVIAGGDRLQRLSQHPSLTVSPPSADLLRPE